MLRYMTCGESHGKGLMVILEGIPAGLSFGDNEWKFVQEELKRRMHGYGRGGRMSIEEDKPEIISGIRKGKTIGSPIGIFIRNSDYKIDELPDVKHPRPGHADMAGIQKYGFSDARDVLERASARETAVRVAAGAVAKILLKEFGIEIISHVVSLGGIEADVSDLSFEDIKKLSSCKESELRCADKKAEKLMCQEIDKAKESGDTLGGSFEVIAKGVPVGLGSYVQWDRRLDAKLAMVLMSIQAIKAVSIGDGIDASARPGSTVHDEIICDEKTCRVSRKTNNAGGLEGGVTNGEDIVLSAFMKPIATLKNALSTIDIDTKKEAKASTERSDVTAVPACGVVAEAVVAIEIASSFLDKFGGDSISEIKRNMKNIDQV